MNKNKSDISVEALRAIVPDAYNIRQPHIPGALRSVFFVDSERGTYVCKINHYDLAMKNAAISTLMRENEIKAPQISVMSCSNGMWIEKYPLIQGKTLYERIGDGISPTDIERIYQDLVKTFHKISKIDYKFILPSGSKYIDQVARTNISDTNNTATALFMQGLLRIVNRGKNCGLHHCGITPKNIIISDDGQFAGLTDMDEVALSNPNYAFATMAAKYRLLGMNTNDLMDYYEHISGHKLNRSQISAMVGATNVGRHILWRMSGNRKAK